MSEFGILKAGAYVPRLRLDRAAIAAMHGWMAPALRSLAKGERAFCSWDEDAVTMAVEAARDCLDGDASGIAALALASTSFPYADLQHGALIGAALGLAPGHAAIDIGHSQRAGTTALAQALKAGEEALVVASDRPVARPASTQEMLYGAGAAAFRIGTGEIIARLIAASSVAEPFIDHFRSSGARYDYFWEERWIRDEGYLKIAPQAAGAVLDKAGLEIGDIAHLVMALPMRGAVDAVARKIDFSGTVADSLDGRSGYAGCAHALLMLAGVLETARAGERILVIGFGQGADAIVLEVTGASDGRTGRNGLSGALAERVPTDSYGRMLSFYDGIDLDWGMRAEKSAKTILTEQYRASDQIMNFVAGRCGECGAIQFPQLHYCVSPGCQAPAAQFAQVSLADAPFEVMTFTADWLSYHPAPPLHVGFVQFENGARLMMEMVDIGPDGIDVGTPLRAVFRIQARDRERGYNRYFWKATPVPAARGDV
ncbi:3-hydroxy-3-methylglutaryl CoA synthase [Sphingomonas sp.]|uniref:3-hydroxy-3-methylglutaryl CoA synthase n=1 Tax=Sphingomonas sp. TaxID=28214 RepID=UPI001ED7A0BF|nr:3-hydroxy-3-methylglutaryl CoA synthase [Sphingomonas sp.]MBX3595050.1 OB-fold domain-containing protein [Sphingomonas sp.]